MSNTEELKKSKGDILENGPSEIDVMHQVVVDLRDCQSKALESHEEAGSLPRGNLSLVPDMEVQKMPAGDSLLVADVTSTTDCMLQGFADLHTNQPKALECHGRGSSPLSRKFNSMPNISVLQTTSEQLHDPTDALPDDLLTLKDEVATAADEVATAADEVATAADEPSAGSILKLDENDSLLMEPPLITPAVIEKIESVSSTPLVQPATEILGLEDSMPNIAINLTVVESAGGLKGRSESVDSLEPVTDVGCSDNADKELPITPISAKRRRSLWSRTKKFFRTICCCGAKKVPLD